MPLRTSDSMTSNGMPYFSLSPSRGTSWAMNFTSPMVARPSINRPSAAAAREVMTRGSESAKTRMLSCPHLPDSICSNGTLQPIQSKYPATHQSFFSDGIPTSYGDRTKSAPCLGRYQPGWLLSHRARGVERCGEARVKGPEDRRVLPELKWHLSKWNDFPARTPTPSHRQGKIWAENETMTASILLDH